MKTLLLFCFLGFGFYSYSQLLVQNRVLSSSGNTFSDGVTVIDFTFGETFTSTMNPSTGLVYTQGFQQPTRRRISADLQPSSNAGIEELDDFTVSVYPNPFISDLVIEIPENYFPRLLLYDNAGRLVLSLQLTDVQTNIDLSEIAPGNYQLLLQEGDLMVARISVVKTF